MDAIAEFDLAELGLGRPWSRRRASGGTELPVCTRSIGKMQNED